MDQGAVSSTQEKRNGPFHQCSPPRYIRLPCKLRVRKEKGKACEGLDLRNGRFGQRQTIS